LITSAEIVTFFSVWLFVSRIAQKKLFNQQNSVWKGVTGHMSEGSFVRNGGVQIPKSDANPNPNPNLCLYVSDK